MDINDRSIVAMLYYSFIDFENMLEFAWTGPLFFKDILCIDFLIKIKWILFQTLKMLDTLSCSKENYYDSNISLFVPTNLGLRFTISFNF